MRRRVAVDLGPGHTPLSAAPCAMTAVAEFTPMLRAALAEVKAAGLGEAAGRAEGRCFAAYTTSSEWLGEVGSAVSVLLREHGTSLPETTRAKLKSCLDEVAKVWPR